MFEKERIREAERNVKSYLEDNLLWKYSEFRTEILETYLRNYQESLNVAQKLFAQNWSSLWAVVISYYSMYYIANAVLYKFGYKVGSKISHKITSDALIIFVRNKLKESLLKDFEEAKEEALEIIGRKADEVLLNYERELEKRSSFQYQSTEEIKRNKAETSLERAKTFIFEMKKLL